MCAAVPVRALLQLPLLGVNRGYKGLYGGGWPLRGMGAAGTALGAADARTNEHYEIGTILTQKSQGGARGGDPRISTPGHGQEPHGIQSASTGPVHVGEQPAPPSRQTNSRTHTIALMAIE